jgi:pSer/pThr/pTyr-binding forkhead associated (FHA) protein
VGRSTKNDVILSSNFVSDKHATLRYLAGALEIMDDFSTSGTFVNDELIKDRIELKNDDRIKIGNINLRVKLI